VAGDSCERPDATDLAANGVKEKCKALINNLLLLVINVTYTLIVLLGMCVFSLLSLFIL